MPTFSLGNAAKFVGQELGISAWETLGQARIDQFADCTGDRQWIHVDVERARRESPLRSTIAHGYLVLSLLAPALFEIVVGPAGITQALNYGLDKVRFMSPVKAGSRVRNRVKLVAVEQKGEGRHLLTTEHTMEIEDEPKPALVAVALVLAVVS
jgi:acyl dehydratase